MGIFRNLFGSTRPTSPCTAKPTVEALDQRLVLSTASINLHAVKGSASYFDETDTFYINRQNGVLYEQVTYKIGSWYGVYANPLYAPQSIRSFSAGHDVYGQADVFAKFGDGSLWYWDHGGWNEFDSLYDNSGSFAAANGGRVYFSSWNQSLWEYTIGAPWYSAYTLITGAGAAQSIDAVTDSTGNDAVFALDNSGNFGEYYGSPGSGYSYTPLWSSWYGLGISPGFSAGLDGSGRADVYAKDYWGDFWEHDSYSGWRYVAPPSAVQGNISATINEAVYVADWNGNVQKYIGTMYSFTDRTNCPFPISCVSRGWTPPTGMRS